MNINDYTQISQLTAESGSYEEFYIKTTLAGYNADEVKFDFVKQSVNMLVNMNITELNDIVEGVTTDIIIDFIADKMTKDNELHKFMSSVNFIAYVLNLINSRYRSKTYSIDTENSISGNYCKKRDYLLAKLFLCACNDNKELKQLCDKDGNNILLIILCAYDVIDKLFYLLNFYEPRLRGQDSYYKILEQTFGDTARAFIRLGVAPFQKNKNGKSFAEVLGPYYDMLLNNKEHKSNTFDYV